MAPAMGLLKAYAVAFVSMLAGAAVIHNLYQPDLRLKVEDVQVEEVPQQSQAVSRQLSTQAPSVEQQPAVRMPRISPRSSRSWDSDDSGGEDREDKDEAIQSGIFRQYLEICDDLGEEENAERDGVFARGLARVQEYLCAGQSNSMCLICLATIKPSQAVWDCGESCYAVFHLPCIQEWARNQLEAATLRASNQLGHEASQAALAEARAAACWGCPKCRQLYPRTDLPSRYTCFCGKEPDPEWDPWLAPHTCGQLCEKPLPGSCQHTCTLLCHPGPCPPCPLVVAAKCHCGKLTLKQRCGHNQFSCREVCGKRLACGHTCPDTCHPGECSPCQQLGTYKCRCGSESKQLACSKQDFQCAKICGKSLVCGRHRCEQQCHSGACGGCPFEGARSCPCGKTTYPGLKCDETAVPCGESCGKLLACGIHTCVERCHLGECPKVCRDVVTKTCRCGKTQKAVLCHQEVLCEKRCTAMRGCGRHPCKRKCCDGVSCPPCEEVCNRWLRCGNHRCPAPCHTGPCRPCPLTFSVTCACGATKHTLPCGAESKAVPPRCSKPCPVPALCRHATEHPPHRCHYGPCPPCRSPCRSQLACGHVCNSGTCHDPPPPAVADWQLPKPTKTSTQAAAAAGAASSKGAGAGNGRSSSPVDVVQPAAAAAAAAAHELLGAAAAAAAGGGGKAASSGSGGSEGAATRTSCPACTVQVDVQCLGQHLKQPFPCHEAKPFSCGWPCGQPLACGNHTCSKPCHTISTTAAAQAVGGGGTSTSSGRSSSTELANRAGSSSATAAAGVVACEVCTRPCTRPRSCEHPCSASCHPGPCEPCQVARSCSCHCGKSSLRFPCCDYQSLLLQQEQQQQQQQQGSKRAKQAAAQGAAGPLCCGKPCHRELQFCRHPCRAACHQGDCPAPEQCDVEVTVRCECRRQKQKWLCCKVQEALLASTRDRHYDSAVAPRVLACDAACAAGGGGAEAAAGKGKRSSSPAEGPAGAAAGKAAAKQPAAAAAAAAAASTATAAATAAAKPSSKKLTRAEREALAAQKEAERKKQEQRKKLQAWLHFLQVMLVIVAVGVALGLGVFKLLSTVDQKAQEAWRPDEIVSGCM